MKVIRTEMYFLFDVHINLSYAQIKIQNLLLYLRTYDKIKGDIFFESMKWSISYKIYLYRNLYQYIYLYWDWAYIYYVNVSKH